MATSALYVLSSSTARSGLSAGTVAITLAAALLHAIWNAVAHGVPDRLLGFALIGVAYGAAGGLAAAVLGAPPADAWPFVAASAAAHVVYMLLLWWSYELGDYSQVYPVARGTAPWLVALAEVIGGHALPWAQLAGIVVISVGLLGVALGPGRVPRGALPALGAAVATGVAIAGYTVIDAEAVFTTPVGVYAAWMFLLQAPVMPAIALLRRRRAVLALSRGAVGAGLAGGLVSLAAYVLVLVAQTSGATAAVAALRETSIVIGALLGVLFLGEPLGRRRVAAAVVVVAGIVLVNL